jgi:hypothetical protein
VRGGKIGERSGAREREAQWSNKANKQIFHIKGEIESERKKEKRHCICKVSLRRCTSARTSQAVGKFSFFFFC